MCICGVPFAFSYFINVAVLKSLNSSGLSGMDFCRMDARTENRCDPGVWGVWYALLLGGLLLAALHQRKERKEL